MRIAIFDGSFETTAFIRRLIQGLIDAGHEVYVLGFNEKLQKAIPRVYYVPLGSNQNTIRFLKVSLVYSIKQRNLFDFIRTVQLIIKGDRMMLQQNNLTSFINKKKPDIIHVQWPSLLKWVAMYLHDKNLNIVLSQRGYQTNIKSQIDTHYKNYLKDIYPLLDGIHSVSKAISLKGKKIGQPSTKIDHVVYTGLNFNEFTYRNYTNNTASLELISVGRSHWKKDYKTALLACKLLLDKKIEFRFTVIGAENDEEVLFLINLLGLDDYVTITGRVSQNEVKIAIQKSQIMLLSSVEEGIANVAVEAMALGTPVISTDCGGMQELINHNKEGWIVPKRNPKAMAEAILNFTTLTAKDVETIRLNARRKVKKQHSEEKMISDMEDLYKKVIETKI